MPNKLAVVSVIAQFMSENFNLQQVQLTFEELPGAHNGEVLAVHLYTVLCRFGLHDGKLLATTTDNASSNYKMVKLLQKIFKKKKVK